MPALLHDEHIDLDSNRIHISSGQPNDFEVWLNTDAGDFDGLCIGCGPTREIAISEAVAVLREGIMELDDVLVDESHHAASGRE